jgi:hypothetical protein
LREVKQTQVKQVELKQPEQATEVKRVAAKVNEESGGWSFQQLAIISVCVLVLALILYCRFGGSRSSNKRRPIK